MRVVMLSNCDFASSAWRIREAVRSQCPDIEILLVKYQNGKFMGNADFCIVRNSGEPEDFYFRQKQIVKNTVQSIIDGADIVHFKGDDPPTRDFHGFKIPDKAKLIVTVSGSGFRREAPISRNAKHLWSMSDYMIANVRTAMTPDLNYPDFKGIYTPQAINSSNKQIKHNWSERPLISHSPSNRYKKGTDSHVIPALQILRDKYKLKFRTEIIEGLPLKNCIARKSIATVFIDQIISGYFGNAGLEAMQFGIPTLACFPNEVYKQSSGIATRSKCPVINPEPTPEAIAKALYDLLSDKGIYDSVALKTKRYCDDVHSYEAVGGMWCKIYNDLINRG